MDVKDSISVTLKTIDGKETKDQSAKNIFSYKPIMSNILKYTVEEYDSDRNRVGRRGYGKNHTWRGYRISYDR